MKRIISSVIALSLLASLGLAGCTQVVEAKTGTIEVRVTDAPAGYEVTSIMIWVAEEDGVAGVEVHRAADDGDGEWIPIEIVNGNNPFDLTLLVDGLQQVLAIGAVDPGRYTQIRMAIDRVEVTLLEDGETTTYEAKLPGGKLKFVRPFDVVEGEVTTILLDFIAEKSVVVTGATVADTEQARVIFKPVVKLEVQQGGSPHQLAEVEGTISAVDTTEGATTVSIIPEGGAEVDTIVLNVNPQTELTLDGNPATLAELAALGEGNTVTASYYLDNLKATQIDAQSPPPPV
ncbi:MAG: DUF4382 domain-containing protein [Dehalococcoidales bacterium]